MAAVSVVEDADGVARLRINNRQQEGSSATFRFDARQAWLPLLLHPAPARALFLGLGTGVTARAAADDPNLRVDAVELLPEVIEASARFHPRARARRRPRNLRVIAADARRYVRASDQRYDVIVSDNFHPARSGSAALYTVEHFEAVRRRLRAGGVFCQWLPLHQLDLETLRNIVQSFVAAFPQGWAMLASNSLETPVLGLIGRRRTTDRFDAATIRDRLMRAPLPPPIAGIGLEDEFAVLGSFVAGPAALKRFAGDAAANTDDHPIVAYRAPRITYAPDSQPRDRLFALLQRSDDRALRADRANRPTRPGRNDWPRTGSRAIASSSRAATCGPRHACRRCWRRCASRCWRCCASARTFGPRTIRCSRWRPRSPGRISPARAACSPSCHGSSRRAARRRAQSARSMANPLRHLADLVSLATRHCTVTTRARV